MKKLLFVLAVGLIGLMVNAQTSAPQQAEQTPVDPNGPVITFETEEVDFGTIEQGSDPFRVVKFTNTGKKPLLITSCKGSCGCTVPDCNTSKPYMPGETGELKVRYDTQRVGKISKTVTVKSNANNGTIYLKVVGTILAKPTQDQFPANNGNGPVSH